MHTRSKMVEVKGQFLYTPEEVGITKDEIPTKGLSFSEAIERNGGKLSTGNAWILTDMFKGKNEKRS